MTWTHNFDSPPDAELKGALRKDFYWGYATAAAQIEGAWDTPQALEDRYRGMLNQEKYTSDFLRYARVCFERFGDRVKHWITYNEPGVYTLAGYAGGVHAPGRSSYRDRNEEGDSSTEPFI